MWWTGIVFRQTHASIGQSLAASTMAKKSEMIAVCWDRSNSVYHGVVHSVSRSLAVSQEDNRVIVHWPRKGKEPEVWHGTIVEQSGKSSAKGINIELAHCLSHMLHV